MTVTISVRDLLDSPFEADLGDRGSRLLVRRAPGDALRMEYESRPLVFEPEERFPVVVRPHLTSIPDGTAIEVEAALCNARTGKEDWVHSRKIVLDPTFFLSLDVPMPAREGGLRLDRLREAGPEMELAGSEHAHRFCKDARRAENSVGRS